MQVQSLGWEDPLEEGIKPALRIRGFPGLSEKNPPVNGGDVGSIPGLGGAHRLQSN